ncbi:hypothetical protein MITS9509_00793 [Synechococcus sp. MIT S9509]|nr:hypothetical protein MITS9504_00936 [Synechococcus sp. MIT S9504]KZR92920.1 hypothetical protein MITS9509_00793 [Synechococcus sp. MIT S9509]
MTAKRMKTVLLLLVSGLLAVNEVAHAQTGALKYGNIAAGKYCEARKQGRSHTNALQLAMMDGTASSRKYSAQQGSVENQNARVDFNSYIDTMCPQYLKDFGEGGIQNTVMHTGLSCLSSVDIYNGVKTGVVSKSCTDGSIYIKVHN